MKKEIPVTFNHKAKDYSGHFTQIQGAGNSAVYHLMVDSYYKGRLRYSEFTKGWMFDSNSMPEMAGYFEEWARENLKQ